MNDTPEKSAVDNVENAIVNRIVSGTQSISVDGMSTSFQSLDSMTKALSALKKSEAGKNPLGCLKIFKIKSQG